MPQSTFSLLDVIQRYFGTWIVKPTVLIKHYDFKYNENQSLFINRTKRDGDCHVCIFGCDTVAYICDTNLLDDGENIVAISNLTVIALPPNRFKKSAPIDIPKTDLKRKMEN